MFGLLVSPSEIAVALCVGLSSLAVSPKFNMSMNNSLCFCGLVSPKIDIMTMVLYVHRKFLV